MDTLIYTQSQENVSKLQGTANPNSILHIQTNLAPTLQCLKDNTFQTIVLDSPNLNELNQTSFHSLYSVLKAGGLVRIHTAEQSASLKDLYTIAGFKEETSGDSATLVLKKPDWAGKGVASLKKKANVANGTTENKESTQNTVKVGQMEVEKTEEKKSNPFEKFSAQATNATEYINEDNLLENEEGYNRLGKDEDCSVKPKACANCSCGRAEKEAAGDTAPGVIDEALLKKIETGDIQTGCGKCFMGDAFRCGTCPYRGLPAFKPGDKIKLDLTKDSLGGVLKEESDVVVTNGKVKIQL